MKKRILCMLVVMVGGLSVHHSLCAMDFDEQRGDQGSSTKNDGGDGDGNKENTMELLDPLYCLDPLYNNDDEEEDFRDGELGLSPVTNREVPNEDFVAREQGQFGSCSDYLSSNVISFNIYGSTVSRGYDSSDVHQANMHAWKCFAEKNLPRRGSPNDKAHHLQGDFSEEEAMRWAMQQSLQQDPQESGEVSPEEDAPGSAHYEDFDDAYGDFDDGAETDGKAEARKWDCESNGTDFEDEAIDIAIAKSLSEEETGKPNLLEELKKQDFKIDEVLSILDVLLLDQEDEEGFFDAQWNLKQTVDTEIKRFTYFTLKYLEMLHLSDKLVRTFLDKHMCHNAGMRICRAIRCILQALPEQERTGFLLEVYNAEKFCDLFLDRLGYSEQKAPKDDR